jgi:hypothetical protein
MAANGPDTDNGGRGRVLRFERRGISALRGRTSFAAPPRPRRSVVEDLDKYTYRGGEPEDDRQRLITNAAASLILITLIACGVWLADTIIAMRDRQDCVLSGRTNCAPIERHEHGAALQN